MTARAIVVLLAALVSWPACAEEHSLAITGPEQLFLSRDAMACGGTARGSGRDTVDMPVTAFRRKDGSVIVLASNQNNYYLEGPSIERARRVSCASLISPINDADPTKFMGRRWVFALHAVTEDFVLGFVHTEYHGNDFFRSECKKTSTANFECWYGSTTLIVSRDGGFTFQTPEPPHNVLASLPFVFDTAKKRAGANSPKVVGNPKDGKTYVMINYHDRNRGIGYQCLLRGAGNNLDDWRAWDGQAFSLEMNSPYVTARGADCAPVLRFAVLSVKYIPKLKKFIALGFEGAQLVYAFSDDLLKWSAPTKLMDVTRAQNWRPGGPPVRVYFSLLDDTSASINFDTLEFRPYLYFVQVDTADRRKVDLYRMPVAIQ